MDTFPNNNDTSDPTDWLPTSLSAFAPLETALRCGVCKEFYDTPMITSCSHTFCSLCIRRCLSSEGKCPTCRANEQASKLRRNWAVEEVVANFKLARPAALGLARDRRKEEEGEEEAPKRPGKRRRIEKDPARATRSTRTTRSQSKRMVSSQEEQAPIEIDSDGSEEYQEEPEDGLVACPICQQRMRVDQVDPHIQRGCPDEREEQKKRQPSKPPNPLQQLPSRTPSQPLERLAELNYSLLKDNALKKKLQELGIPTWGSRQLLVRRHTEWVNLWNSNCDSNRSKSKRELLRELDMWENSQGGNAREGRGSSNNVMNKDFDAPGWASSNNDHFSRLIADARKKRNTAPAPEAEKPTAPEGEKAMDGTIDGSPEKPQTSQKEHSEDKPTANPYENNPSALSSIREKVSAANRGEHIEPQINQDFRQQPKELIGDITSQRILSSAAVPAVHITPPDQQKNVQMVDGKTDGKIDDAARHDDKQHYRDGSPCDLPGHFSTSTYQVPMFQVPEGPFVDIDGSERG